MIRELFESLRESLDDLLPGRSRRLLEEKEETLEAILENMSEGVLATDLKCRVMFANPAARGILGVEGDELLQRPVPSPFEDFDLRRAVERCARVLQCEGGYAHAGETAVQVGLKHLPKFDDHRGGVLVLLRDLSEEQRLEANQQRFIANAAHELKTPITAILGATELLLTGEQDPGRQRRLLEDVRTEAVRMQRLSDTLLRLARVGAERREPHVRRTDPAGVAGEAVERMEPIAQGASVELRLEVRDRRPVLADPEHLEQALLVLLSNAVKHSPEGRRVLVWVDGGRIAVEDEGEGISPEELPRIFERFYKGPGSGGFGLGLSICRDLVEGMGGTVRVSSREGEGSTFEIELKEMDEDAQGTGR
ncbi:MAG: PAS domain-containing sensor histidine kinase [Rubrobacteraceae bacterium]|nr:PAS domain-containing sensor histidine kinase [Rubrobacteraceae bacterium]MCL6437817.1 PAS domain-containing sensor histidine kinase [Rubrobacteraceae bacterium]